MKNWKDIKIPEIMKNLVKDQRGFPVPYIVLNDKNNTPHFKVNDVRKVEQCITEKRCGICGTPLNDDMWMIGGPMSAFHPHGVYVDSPMHKDCAKYALQVCPYLAVSIYNGKQTMDELLSIECDNKIVGFVNPTQTLDRVPFFVFSKISGFVISGNRVEHYIKPHKPFLEIEFWNNGVRIDEKEAQKLIDSK